MHCLTLEEHKCIRKCVSVCVGVCICGCGCVCVFHREFSFFEVYIVLFLDYTSP